VNDKLYRLSPLFLLFFNIFGLIPNYGTPSCANFSFSSDKHNLGCLSIDAFKCDSVYINVYAISSISLSSYELIRRSGVCSSYISFFVFIFFNSNLKKYSIFYNLIFILNIVVMIKYLILNFYNIFFK